MRRHASITGTSEPGNSRRDARSRRPSGVPLVKKGYSRDILTNLPARVRAKAVARLYQKRWTIEGAFQELTVALKCEVNTLAYPKAALFGFCVALLAFNVLAVVKAALRAAHGVAPIEETLST